MLLMIDQVLKVHQVITGHKEAESDITKEAE
jgi:hypothetical protein